METKKLAHIGLAFLFIALLAACQVSEAKIKPGDKIEKMEFINEYEKCPAPNLNEICSFESLFKGTCKIPESQTKFWISTGWLEGSQPALELAWQDSEWHMTFDGMEVDLPAFGTYDLDWQTLGGRAWDVHQKTYKEIRHGQEKVRMWKVCISNPEAGMHTVRYEFLMKNGVWIGNHVETFIFTVSDSEIPKD